MTYSTIAALFSFTLRRNMAKCCAALAGSVVGLGVTGSLIILPVRTALAVPQISTSPPAHAPRTGSRADFIKALSNLLPAGVIKTLRPFALPTLPQADQPISFVISADGRRIAYQMEPERAGPGAPRRISVCNADGSEDHPLIVDMGHPNPVIFSPDGKSLLVVGVGGDDQRNVGLFNVPLANPEAAKRISPPDLEGGTGEFSPDGSRVAFIARDPVDSDKPFTLTNENGWVYVARKDGSGCRRLSQGDDVAWSPDGNSLVFKGWAGEGAALFILRVDSKTAHPQCLIATSVYPKVIPRDKDRPKEIGAFGWRDGKTLLVNLGKGNLSQLIVVRVADGREMERVRNVDLASSTYDGRLFLLRKSNEDDEPGNQATSPHLFIAVKPIKS